MKICVGHSYTAREQKGKWGTKERREVEGVEDDKEERSGIEETRRNGGKERSGRCKRWKGKENRKK